ncbi:uncharacterized protein F5Z01DRAFT_692057 [Emericellopsis atlantica]|uniref:Uncharacterized protein n=1 Tax=Emericellopsis atlantica TaxID=2614577 RepID=A0A9P7ZGG6_9HYPO|nr:uncharacterized protein F5Z01DRAFT_692057 [Emericellopsis atlantica]KAG9251649.1 hypothetical protein F5Z01DRAFT_692057 [Emericellopsis atlantica]
MAPDAAQRKAGLDRMIGEMSKTGIEEAADGYTLGWDIVVTYSEKEINDILRRKWEKARQDSNRNMLTTIEVHQSSYDDETGMYRYSWRTMELGPPRVEFGGTTEPSVNLVLPVENIYYQKSNKEKTKIGERKKQLDVPNPFDVRLSGIRLGSVVGKYDAIMQPKQEGKVANADTLSVPVLSSQKTVVFREDNTKPTDKDFENAWVVLDFPMGETALKVDVSCNVQKKSDDDEVYELAYAQTNIFRGVANSYFKDGSDKIDILEYAMATIKNIPEYNGAVTADLTPVSFRFATFKTDLQEGAALSLFIQTLSGSNSGTQMDLQGRWIGSWTKHGISPLPAGYTASILINPHLAYEAMLKPGLEKNGEFTVESIMANKEGGISFSARYQQTWSVGTTYYDYKGKVYECRLWIDGWYADLKNTDSAPVAKVDWEFSVDNKWKDTSRHERPEAFGNHILFMEENMRTQYKLHKDLGLHIQVTDKNFTFDINTDDLHTLWDINTSPRDADGDWFDRASTAMNNFVSASPPDAIHKKREEWMSGLRPSIDFNAVGLGFFLTTNLLNPGAKIIKLDPNVLRIPRDIVLVGDVEQGTDTVKAQA